VENISVFRRASAYKHVLEKAIKHVADLQEIKTSKEPMLYFYLQKDGIVIQDQKDTVEELVPITINTSEEWFILNPSFISKAIQPFEHENIQMGIYVTSSPQ